MSIALQLNLSENGGKLFLAIRRCFAFPRIYETIRYGRLLDVLSNITKSMVRPCSTGLFPLENTSISPPFQSIICGAMAFDPPDVTLVRESKVSQKCHMMFFWNRTSTQ